MIFTREDADTHLLQTVFVRDGVNRITVEHRRPIEEVIEKELLILLRTFSRPQRSSA